MNIYTRYPIELQKQVISGHYESNIIKQKHLKEWNSLIFIVHGLVRVPLAETDCKLTYRSKESEKNYVFHVLKFIPTLVRNRYGSICETKSEGETIICPIPAHFCNKNSRKISQSINVGNFSGISFIPQRYEYCTDQKTSKNKHNYHQGVYTVRVGLG